MKVMLLILFDRKAKLFHIRIRDPRPGRFLCNGVRMAVRKKQIDPLPAAVIGPERHAAVRVDIRDEEKIDHLIVRCEFRGVISLSGIVIPRGVPCVDQCRRVAYGTRFMSCPQKRFRIARADDDRPVVTAGVDSDPGAAAQRPFDIIPTLLVQRLDVFMSRIFC